MQDLLYAARNLWRNRGFGSAAIAILAIGIAASTGLFAVVDAIVLHPLPYAGADRLVRVRLQPQSGPSRLAMVTADEFRALRRASTLDGAYIQDGFTKTLGGTSFPESVWIQHYTGNALTQLGVQPLIGRVFTEADAPFGAEPARVAVLTYGFWQRRFAGDPSAIGQTVRLDGEPFTVIGVMRQDYSMDLSDIVLPLEMTREAGATWPVLLRVKADTSMAAAEGELQRLYEQFARTRPDGFPRSFRVQVRRMVDEERGAAQVPILGLLFAAAGLLLLIGSVNVTILLLARGRHRVHEIAVRYALGAARSRIMSLLLCETVLVTLAAAVLAVVVAQYVLPLVLTSAPGAISQRAGRIVVGTTAILFAASLSGIVALVSGLWPAIAVSRARSDAMRVASTIGSRSSGSRVGSAVLVAAQVTIAVVLLAGTGAAIRALIDLYRAPLGYDPTRVTIAQIYLPIGSYTSWAERTALYERLRSEVRRVSGVEGSSISLIPTGPPPTGGMLTRIDADRLRGEDREAIALLVASDYFSTLKMPLVRGRTWSVSDDARAEAVTVINETMARQLWPHEDPIGKRVRDRSLAERRSQWILNAPGHDGWFAVIGVVRDAPNRGVREPISPAMYYPYTTALSDTAVLLVRTTANPAAAERELRLAVGRADGNLPIIRFITPETFTGWQQGRFVTEVLLGFAGVALLLAAFGLFSVASYSIAHRTREFGIRIALGAAPHALLRSALQSVVVAVAVGLGLGLMLSVALNSVLAQWAIRNMDDPLVLGGVVGTLLVSTVGAALIPARRATSIEPVIALRTE
ncbi:MAG TPA: ABC transporter permease [Vicinamibacterales bacterium]